MRYILFKLFSIGLVFLIEQQAAFACSDVLRPRAEAERSSLQGMSPDMLYAYHLVTFPPEHISLSQGDTILLKIDSGTRGDRQPNDTVLVQIGKDGSRFYVVSLDNSGDETSERYYFRDFVRLGRDEETSRFRMDEYKPALGPVVSPAFCPEHAFIDVDSKGRIVVSRHAQSGTIWIRHLSVHKIYALINEGQAKVAASDDIVFEYKVLASERLPYNIWELPGGYAITGQDNKLLPFIGLTSNNSKLYSSAEEAQAAVAKWRDEVRQRKEAIAKIILRELSLGRLSILFVCTANVNRSAIMHMVTEDFVVRQGLQQAMAISSAATIETNARDIRSTYGKISIIKRDALEKGIDKNVIDRFTSQALTGETISEQSASNADIIIVADEMHRDFIIEKFPGARSKVFLFNELLPATHEMFGVGVPDDFNQFGHIQRVLQQGLFPLLAGPIASRGKEPCQSPPIETDI